MPWLPARPDSLGSYQVDLKGRSRWLSPLFGHSDLGTLAVLGEWAEGQNLKAAPLDRRRRAANGARGGGLGQPSISEASKASLSDYELMAVQKYPRKYPP